MCTHAHERRDLTHVAHTRFTPVITHTDTRTGRGSSVRRGGREAGSVAPGAGPGSCTSSENVYTAALSGTGEGGAVRTVGAGRPRGVPLASGGSGPACRHTGRGREELTQRNPRPNAHTVGGS